MYGQWKRYLFCLPEKEKHINTPSRTLSPCWLLEATVITQQENCVLVKRLRDITCLRKCTLKFNKKKRGKSGVIKAYHPCTACVQSATSFLWNTAMFSPSRPRLGSCWTTPVAAILSAQTWACCTSVLSHISGLAPWRARLSLCAFKQALPKVNKIYN